LPVTSLIFRQNGLRVATVGKDDKVAMKSVEIGRDYGTKVEIVAGLDPSDRVIDSPPDWLAQGDTVRAAQLEKAGPTIAATHASEGSKQ